jgi:hypothetical protein
MDLEELKSIYALFPDEFQEIQNTIIEIFTSGVKPVNSPAIIILGGQPGSGKSELTTFHQFDIRTFSGALPILELAIVSILRQNGRYRALLLKSRRGHNRLFLSLIFAVKHITARFFIGHRKLKLAVHYRGGIMITGDLIIKDHNFPIIYRIGRTYKYDLGLICFFLRSDASRCHQESGKA